MKTKSVNDKTNFETATEIVFGIKNKKISTKDVEERSLNRIKKINPKINALISDSVNLVSKDSKKISINSENTNESLSGVPISFKDNIALQGRPMSAGSNSLKTYISSFNATVAQKLLDSGAKYFGRCNLDEFAMGSTSETSIYGAVKNPWNFEYSAGGSSGGSAAAVAAGLTPISIGTDTGGSIRLPATHCGVLGLKPTYGSLSRYGLVAYGSSLDQAGPIARSVADLKTAFLAMRGKDIKDSTSVSHESKVVSKNKIARIPNLEKSITDVQIKESLDAAQKSLESKGFEFINADLSLSAEEIVAIYYIIALSEASSNLARFDGLRYGTEAKHRDLKLEDYYKKFRGEGFGFEVKARIMMGTFCLSEGHYDAWFIKAAQLRQVLKQNIDQILQNCEAILLPVSSEGPPKLNRFSGDPTDMYKHDAYTAIANLTGTPAVSIPIKLNDDNLPVGVQLIGSAFADLQILELANLLEVNNEILNTWPSQVSEDV